MTSTASPVDPTPSSAVTTCAGAGTSRSRAAVTTASVPSLPTSSCVQVVAGVVLQQAGETAQDAAVGEHRLDAHDLGAHRAVPQDLRAARVRRDHAADRRAAARAVIDAEGEPGRGGVLPGRRSSVTPAPAVTWAATASTGPSASSRTSESTTSPPRGTPAPTSPVFPP